MKFRKVGGSAGWLNSHGIFSDVPIFQRNNKSQALKRTVDPNPSQINVWRRLDQIQRSLLCSPNHSENSYPFTWPLIVVLPHSPSYTCQFFKAKTAPWCLCTQTYHPRRTKPTDSSTKKNGKDYWLMIFVGKMLTTQWFTGLCP